MTSFVLNGQRREVQGLPGLTVLDFLRLEARLTGTKEGCAEGDCGACSVAVARQDGGFLAVNSCIMLLSDLDGCVVVTAEGVAQDGKLGAGQAAMVALHGSQCGFCTPGFVMSLFAVEQNPLPEDRGEFLLDAVAGNLCRCTGYRPIMAAAATLQHAPDPRIPEWRAALDGFAADETAPVNLAALEAVLAATPGAKLTAGTTDIGVAVAKYGRVPTNMVSLRNVAELRVIAEQPEDLVIGATATYSEVLPYLDKHFENFAKLVRRIGSVQIRNVGTMGGNVCNASPIGDSAPCLIALGAILLLRSAQGEREVAVEDFFVGYRATALRAGEFLRAIRIPYLRAEQKHFAYKLAKRFDQDISTVAAAFMLEVRDGIICDARVGFGGVAATPLRAREIEAALAGKVVEDASFAAAAEVAARIFAPISDFRAGANYRLQGAAGFLHRLGAQAQGDAAAEIWAL
jgi:xanthine dehydrogenase small subunit